MTISELKAYWVSFSKISKKVIIALIISFDSLLGLLYQSGFLNLVDFILLDNLPTDFVWLLQTFQLICMGFFGVKILSMTSQ